MESVESVELTNVGPRVAVVVVVVLVVVVLVVDLVVVVVDFGGGAVHVYVEMRLMLKILCDFLHGVMLACVLSKVAP